MVESIQSNKVLLMLTKLQSVAHSHIFCRISFTNSVTIHWTKSPIYKSPQTFSKDLEPPRFALFCLYLYLVCMILP